MGSSQQANVFCTRSGSVVSDSTKQNCKIPRNANFAHRPMLPRVCVTVSSLLFSAVVSRHVNRVSMFPATLARAFSSVPRAVTSLPSATRPSLPRYVSPAHRRRVVAAAALHHSWLAGAQPYVRVWTVTCVAPAISRSSVGVPSLECVARSMPRRCRRGLATTASKVPQQSQVVPERAGSQGIDCASLHPTRRGSPLPHLSPPYVLAAAVVTQPPATLTPFARCSLAQVTVSPRGDSVSVGDGPVDTNPRFHAQW